MSITFLLSKFYYTYNNEDTLKIHQVWIIIERADKFKV